MDVPKNNYAFVDGSYNPKTKVYGYGGFLIDSVGLKHVVQGHGKNPGMAKMRNVAGEIMGAKAVIVLAIKLGLKSLQLFYDYDGIAKWPMGEWVAKNKYTIAYRDFINKAINKHELRIIFTHVKGHSGIEGNEEADRLAKEAVGLSV